jgi:SAM-dependent methyltransferase
VKRCLACGEAFSSHAWTCPACSWTPAGSDVLEFAPELAASEDHYPPGIHARLAELEEKHFWFTARSELVVWLLRRHFPRPRSVLEVGCGTGGVLAQIAAEHPDVELTGGDLLKEALDVARARVPQATLLQLDARRLPYVDEFDVVCALDVLEHVAEDGAALAEIERSLLPGGGVLVTVPQHPRLWSAADEYGRHRRRYTRTALHARIEEAGLETIRMTSWVTLLLPIVAASRAFDRRRVAAYDPFRELEIARPLNSVFGAVMRAEHGLIRRGLSLPVGTSLVAVARKP